MTNSTDPHDIAERIAESVDAQLDERNGSRRGFLARTAAAGTLLAVGGGTGLVFGQAEDTETESTPTFDDVAGTDVDVLNYALSLEHLESAFYEDVLGQFDEADFVVAESLDALPEAQRREAYTRLQTVGAHETPTLDNGTETSMLNRCPQVTRRNNHSLTAHPNPLILNPWSST